MGLGNVDFTLFINHHLRIYLEKPGSMRFLAYAALTLLCSASRAAAHSEYLHLTALISGDDGIARFECWQMLIPFSTYPTVGEAIPGLATVTNVSYVILPPKSSEGLHNPPHPM